MRLRMTVVVQMTGYWRFMGSSRQCRCLQCSRMVRDLTHRLRKCQRPLHWQEAAEQNNQQLASAGMHKAKLTQLDESYKTSHFKSQKSRVSLTCPL